MAALSIGGIAYLLFLWAICLTPGVVAALKGHVALFVAGFLTLGFVWVIACFRLAKPNSPWAHRFYDEEKMRRSRQRYPHVDPARSSRSLVVLAVVFLAFAFGIVGGFVAQRLAKNDEEVREPARAALRAAP
jgi:hypothetical protein